jgi:regulator of protease activity HflC (stomatin/prohibitin superfamily)
MGDFLRLLLDGIQFLWPLRIVRQWERGGFYVWGRFWKVVGPGIYPIVPWFMEVKEISVVPAIVSTPRLDITLKDGVLASFRAAATVEVVDYNLAVNTVDSFTETIQELLSAVLADRLADVDPERLRPAGRNRLLSDLTRWVNEESERFGIRTSKVRFTTFVLGVRSLRLLQEVGNEQTW